MGSRPVSRNSTSDLHFEDLRAIPFVGAWGQLKQNVLAIWDRNCAKGNGGSE